PFGFNNMQALAVTDAFSKKHRVFNISQLVPVATNLMIGAPAEFMSRADGMPGLKKAYALKFKSVKALDPGLMYKAIHNKEVDVIEAFSTDGRIAEYKLNILNDDKHFFPSYLAAPLIRDQVLKAHPQIATALKPLLGTINDKTMRQLNYEVDVLKQAPTKVAHDFLVAKGLIQDKN
ncbi:unnamed protein product, partial [marine sediment metagenome]